MKRKSTINSRHIISPGGKIYPKKNKNSRYKIFQALRSLEELSMLNKAKKD